MAHVPNLGPFCGYSIRMYTRLLLAASLFLGISLLGCATVTPYDGMSPDDLFQMGAEAYESEDWDDAIRVFERFIFDDPTHVQMVPARMYLARAYYNREDYLTAVSEFTRVLDRHPGDAMAPEASLGVCQSYVQLSPHIQRDQGYTDQAVSACQNVIQDFGSFEVSVQAETLRNQMQEKLAEKILSSGDFYFRRKMFDSAIIYFNQVLTTYPQTQTSAQALLYLYRSYTAINWDTEADDARTRLLRDFPDSEAAVEITTYGDGTGDVDGAGAPGGI
jgi:outer membrane protein assembly factor BamD